MAPRLVSPRIDDNYWRLTKYDHLTGSEVADLLRNAGYHCLATWNKARIMEVALRKETSRPEYRDMKMPESRKYAIARKTIENPKKVSERKLRGSLYAADASPVFDKLLDLPPSYVKLMKEEVLAQFYKSQTFELRFLYIKPSAHCTKGTMIVDPESLLFLYGLSTSNLALLRNLRINISSDIPTYAGHPRITE
ncbi:hypothetical protein Slin15195_G117350 [Septoria linicola]|uniref:Uncharacterized protein n=1 Tax=Septoria linicola TaxID=215465 RepID=A0A9Q9B7A5_9PEZI|nr:hypothetical protein Slin14017_G094360 [Septoria linicola]USW58416.1 hypothetical protein Slin15195_G117350 [Septoria linicola]